jgi:hypothetical protein
MQWHLSGIIVSTVHRKKILTFVVILREADSVAYASTRYCSGTEGQYSVLLDLLDLYNKVAYTLLQYCSISGIFYYHIQTEICHSTLEVYAWIQ